jgi:hypothetical protein
MSGETTVRNPQAPCLNEGENMPSKNLTRRQFVGSAAVVAGAVAVPTLVSLAPAVAAPDPTLPVFPRDAATPSWTPLDEKRARRYCVEMYRDRHLASVGGGG